MVERALSYYPRIYCREALVLMILWITDSDSWVVCANLRHCS